MITTEMVGVREYVDGFEVNIVEHSNGRLTIDATTGSGHYGTSVDLVDVLEWIKKNRPDLIESALSDGDTKTGDGK